MLAADRLADRLTEVCDVDTVGLTSGDEITGTVRSWTPQSCRVECGETNCDVPSSQLAWIHWADRTFLPSTAGSSWITLADATQLHVKSFTFHPGQLTATLRTGRQLRTRPGGLPSGAWESFQAVIPKRSGAEASLPEATNDVLLLSQRLPVAFRADGWTRRSWPLGINRSATGGWLRCPQAAYRYGLAMHAPAAADFMFTRPVRSFVAELCLEASAGRRGSVVFRVFTQRGPGMDWIEAFRTKVVRGGETAVPCCLDLDGATGLRLAVEVADYGHVLDRALWLNARVGW
jgi:hypothetical protein